MLRPNFLRYSASDVTRVATTPQECRGMNRGRNDCRFLQSQQKRRWQRRGRGGQLYIRNTHAAICQTCMQSSTMRQWQVLSPANPLSDTLESPLRQSRSRAKRKIDGAPQDAPLRPSVRPSVLPNGGGLRGQGPCGLGGGGGNLLRGTQSFPQHESQ